MNEIISKKELHLAIIWENGRYKEKEIVKVITEEFELVEKYKINWDKNLFAKNLTSFYGINLPPKLSSKKERHCGNGEFLLITFYDNNPKYSFIETGRGTENVNLNVFFMKEKFRELTGGGHKVHTTNSIKETNHDLIMLFGVSYKDYEKSILDKIVSNVDANNIFKNTPNLITGVNGWKSLDQLFYVMNETLDYVVLRNFEELPDQNYSNEHFDIDLLVRDLDQAIYITNAIKIHKHKDRTAYKIKVDGKDIYFDFRFVSDNYYDESWQNQILENRIISNKGFYRPTDEDYFFSLIYHVLIHKLAIKEDYHGKIKSIFNKLSTYKEERCNFDHYFNLLEKFIYENRYQYTRPNDPSVFLDKKFLNYKDHIKTFSIISIKNVIPFLVNEWKNFSEYIYFIGETEKGEKLVIKSGGIGESARREFKILKVLRKINLKYFPKEFYFRSTPSAKFIAIEKVEGSRLDHLVSSNLIMSKSQEFLKNMYVGIFDILKILHRVKIVHRDIRPQNIIIKYDGTPILIDFQYAVDVERKRFKEHKLIRKKPRLIKGLGSNFAKNPFHWDDAYSVNKIFELLKIEDDPDFLKIKIETSKMIGRYEIVSVHNNFFSKIITLTKNYFLYPIYFIKLNFYKILYSIISIEKFKNKIKKFEKKLLNYLQNR